MDFLVELDPTNPGADLFPIDLEFNVDTSKSATSYFDVWSADNTDFTDDDDIPFIPEVGFINPPDYTDNTPFHILPGLLRYRRGPSPTALKGIHVRSTHWVITFDGWHTFDDHFDPFDGDARRRSTAAGDDGGFDPGDAGFLVDAVGPFNGALDRWQAALVASGVSPTDDAANLINDIASNTDDRGRATSPAARSGDATGDSSGATIRIDPDGGGFEWFVDPTPFDDAEFDGGGPAPVDLTATGGPAFGKVDMLTFFEHEIGHILGLRPRRDGVMRGHAAARRTPCTRGRRRRSRCAPGPGPDTATTSPR